MNDRKSLKFLTIDTSTTACSAALTDEGKIKGEFFLDADKTSSAQLLVGIGNIMRTAGVMMDGLDGIGVALGPGSFTGLRVALVESAPPAPEAAPAPAESEQEYLLQFTIEFDTAKAVIRPKYSAMMEKAADFLLSNPDTVAEIRGHTDSIGKARYNVLLSQRRAESVRKFLVKKYGVDGSRIIVRGYGYYFPIADNATETGRQKNRRTEVTIAIRKGGATPKSGTKGGGPRRR